MPGANETKTLAQNLSAAFTAAGTDVKSILAKIGDFGALKTGEKASLVLALNELKGTIDAALKIDDAKEQTTTTWSSSKIRSAINTAINALINGAPDTLDTLKELSDAINKNKDLIDTLNTLAAGHLDITKAQALSDEQKAFGKANLGIYDVKVLRPETQDGTVSLDSVTEAGLYLVNSPNSLPAGFTGNPVDLAVTVSGNRVIQALGGTQDGRYRFFKRIGTVPPAVGETPASTTWEGWTEVGAQVDLSGYAKADALAAVKKTADDTAKSLNDFKSAVGDTTTDFVQVYTAARDAA